MATKYFDAKTWKKIGQPDLGSKMFYINKKTKQKVWGEVIAIDYATKRGVKLNIKPFKN